MKKFIFVLAIFPFLTQAGSITYFGFDENEQAILNRAISHAWANMLSPAVVNCTMRAAKLEMVSPTIGNVYSNFRNDGTLFRGQMDFLRRASTNHVFPDLEIHAYYADDFSWGRADYDLLKIYETEYKGAYRIGINQRHLSANGNNVAGWSGLIGHEMLHNISHAHPSPNDVAMSVAYDDDYIINAYQNCLSTGGNYRGNNFAITYRCGGRETR